MLMSMSLRSVVGGLYRAPPEPPGEGNGEGQREGPPRTIEIICFLCLFMLRRRCAKNHSLATRNGLDGSGAILEQRPSLEMNGIQNPEPLRPSSNQAKEQIIII